MLTDLKIFVHITQQLVNLLNSPCSKKRTQALRLKTVTGINLAIFHLNQNMRNAKQTGTKNLLDAD